MNKRLGTRPAALTSLLWLAFATVAGAQVHVQRTLSVKDGLAHPQVLAIGEDREGFLWFGTLDGASRFDGLELVSFREEDGLPGNEVHAIFQAPGGPLFFGTSGGTAIYENGQFTRLPAESGVADIPVRAITGVADGHVFFGTNQGVVSLSPDGRYESLASEKTKAPGVSALWMARDGTLYVGTWEDGLLLYQGGRLVRTLGSKDGLPGNSIRAIAEGRDGTIYMGTGHGLALYRDGVVLNPGRDLGPDAHVYAITTAPDGKVFFGAHMFGMFMGPSSGPFRPITTESGQTWSLVQAVHLTRDGTLYFGTERGVGIYELHARVESWIKGIDNLHEDAILSLVGDPAGGAYVGTGRGIAHYTAGEWRRLAPVSNLRHFVLTLHLGASGRLYAGNRRAEVMIYDHDRLVRTLGPKEGLEGWVFAIHESPDTVYIGTTSGLYAMRNEKLVRLWEGDIKAIAQAPEGALYIGTTEELLLYREGVSRRDRLEAGGVLALRQGREGTLYIVRARSLSILRDGQLRTIARQDSVSCMVEDEPNRLFLNTRRGIHVINPTATPIVQEVLTYADGLTAGEARRGACDRDGRGRLWFGFESGGVSAIDPQSRKLERNPPQVRLAGLDLAGRKVPPLPAGQAFSFDRRQSLTVSFLVIDLVAPHRVRYRYRLAETGQDWSETSLRSVQYSQLPHGDHTFEVQAANESGAWGAPARLRLRVEAPFYQRGWFLPLLALTLSGTGAAALAYRTRHLLTLERLRTTIAADLHDQIGSGLTEIAILSEMGEVSRAAATARELTARMNDVVWLVNPRRDSLYQLFLRLKDSYADLFAQEGVLFHTVDLSAFEGVHLTMSYRQNLYLIFKEALHNALRHGQCREIRLDVAVRGKGLDVTLRDDGRGFDPLQVGERGDGLANMQRRAAAIGGRLILESSPGGGTTIRFQGPLR